MSDPHTTFHNARKYLSTYLKQVNHILHDAGTVIEENGWYRIRTNAGKYESELAPESGSAENWLPSALVAFYGPGEKKPWGQPIADFSHIAFIAVFLTNDVPILTLGYFEIHGQTGGVEARLRAHERTSLYHLIDPAGLQSPPPACSSLEFKWPKPSDFNAAYQANGTRMSLVDIPLTLINGPNELQTVLKRFVTALP